MERCGDSTVILTVGPGCSLSAFSQLGVRSVIAGFGLVSGRRGENGRSFSLTSPLSLLSGGPTGPWRCSLRRWQGQGLLRMWALVPVDFGGALFVDVAFHLHRRSVDAPSLLRSSFFFLCADAVDFFFLFIHSGWGTLLRGPLCSGLYRCSVRSVGICRLGIGDFSSSLATR